MEARSPTGTQSIDRAVQLLKHVATHNSAGLTLAQAARDSGLKAPTVHRILASLCEHGFGADLARLIEPRFFCPDGYLAPFFN